MFAARRSLSASKKKSAGVIISSNKTSYVLNTDLTTNYGWNGTSPINVTVTINPGIYVGGNVGPSTDAFTINAFPVGSTINLIIGTGAYIVGYGGYGGSGGSSSQDGYPGGTALKTLYAVTVTNNGTIAGGGGGGGGDGWQNPDYGGNNGSNGAGWALTYLANTSGNGGALGQPGFAGAPAYTQGGAGGAAGNAVIGNSYITWITTGIRLGPIT